ncbi:MAG: hypothetical protein WCD86_16940 [Ktedonobacteraceae bacterium]
MGRQSKGFSQNVGRGWGRILGRSNAQTATAATGTAQTPTTGPLPASKSTDVLGDLFQGAQQPNQPSGNGHSSNLQHTQGGDLNLVNYSPEELVEQVDRALNRVQFGWTRATKWMENYSEVWSVAGPIILVIGTIGEVFLVLWLRQKAQDVIAGLSIVAVALVLEGTFLAVSYKAATIRNRAEKRPEGQTALDKQKLHRQFGFWFALAIGVCATQMIFIAAQTNDTGIGLYGVWAFAILRAVFTLVADGYTAFAHEEKPTTAERALEEEQQRTKHAETFLRQKTTEVTIINTGILEIREAHNAAAIKEVKQTTQLQLERLQSEAQISAMKTQQEQATRMTNLSNNIMRALFDPELPDDQREKLLNIMQGMATAHKLLPQSKVTIEEEADE